MPFGQDPRPALRSLDRLGPWLAGALLAAPVLVFRYPPMTDLPMHEAQVSILRHLDDPAWMPKGLYEVVAPQANQLFHFVAALLSYAVPTDLACKIVVALTILLTPVAAARWLHELGRARWPAMLIAPLACGWMFRWGLAANMMGFALALAFFPILERLSRRPTTRLVLEACGAVLAIFFAHESAAVIFAGVAAFFAIARGGKASVIARRLSPVALALALVVAQAMASKNLAGANMTAIADEYGPGVLERVRLFPGAILGPYDDLRIAAVSGTVLASLVVSLVAHHRSSRSTRVTLRMRLHLHRHAILSAGLFAVFFAFPMHLGGTTLLAFRFLPAACAFAIVACAPRADRASRSPRAPLFSSAAVVLGFLAPIVMLVVETKSFREADARYRALDDVLVHVPMNVAIAQLDLTPNRAFTLVPGAPSRAQAERGGRMLFQLTDMPPNPISLRKDARWDEPLLRVRHAPYAFSPPHDLQRFSYVLVLVVGHWPRYRADVARAFAPEAKLVASAGEWDLYRTTLEVSPLDAPDRPLPTPAPENLADRINRARATASPSP